MTIILDVQVLSYWRAGTGQDRPGTLDAVCARDEYGLPMIPGKHLKGLLRDAVRRAHGFGWSELTEVCLFGGEAGQQNEGEFQGTIDGRLRVGSAFLSEPERGALKCDDGLAARLFETVRSTKIGPTGVADPGSLRFEEVAIPMSLEAELTPLGELPGDWHQGLEDALTLVRAIGARRTRGLGRCLLSLRGGGQ